MSSVPAVPVVSSRQRIEDEDIDIPIPEEPYHDDEEQERPTVSDGEEDEQLPARQHSYEASVVSIQSNPPPYELYPPAKSIFGRFFNWLRKIPSINTHQPIYLPTINNENSSSAKYRIALISISCFLLVLFSFLLFCSLYFSPINYPDPIYPDKTTNSTARFLTLNIFMRPPLIKNNWSDYKDDRLAYIEKYILPEYDVVAFQESFAFASRRKDQLITNARNMGYNYHVESPRKYPWQLGVDGGLLILSRFPIRQSDIIEYPRGQHSDWLSIKGALHALIELNATRKMHFYTTHTQASYDLNNVINEDDTTIRLSQFALLHSFIADTAINDNNPIMVVGDLNVDAAIHPKGVPITRRLNDSSPEYVKMVDVIKGTGVLKRFVSTDERWFEHPWKLNDLKDIVYDHYGYHPITFGDYKIKEDGEIIPAETVLTNWDVLLTAQSIDRIFWSDRQSNIIKPQLPQVQKFWVEENDRMSDEERKETKFTQISDHYGLSCEIHLL
ncbi:Endonuclease/exonuclease/phosphatase [Cokeromyces recurvatus]|uniref:Endonuclease/exonuclease/phosphatase n=1 Tax=Cokeromyces recurvatus TaxID=90255 RepID=UPI002220247F|nr:Endonuclease/exonuclease/phosphatase [Cokeromyces recurvatus]KAI7902406.1 Endonuclease/exonuclease/phosphatase [Cokeromyces recurvatus]